MRRLAVLVLAGCGSLPRAPIAPAPVAAPPRPTPTCTVAADGVGRVWVDGVETAVATPRGAPIATFALPGQLLVAWPGATTLWSATCDGLPVMTAVREDAHADFGRAAVVGDTLAYTTDSGVRTLAGRSITTGCRDEVRGARRGTLFVHRTCGTAELAIDDPLGTPRVRDRAAISALAADRAGALYVARRDELHAIWRSRDGGATWSKLAVPGTDFAIDQLIASGGHLVAHAGSTLLASDDDGARWRMLSNDAAAVASVDGTTRNLVLVHTLSYAGATAVTRDGGDTWADSAAEPPALGLRPVTARGGRYHATTDGLVRDGRRVFPDAGPVHAAAAACDVELDDLHRFWIDGYATGMAAPITSDLERAIAPLVLHVPGGVLFSYRSWGRYGTYEGANVLWRASCGDPPEVREQLSASEALFGWSVLARDGRTLYTAGAHGVIAIDLETRAKRVVTQPEPCPSEQFPQRDYPLELLDGGRRLALVRGSNCGYEGEWVDERRSVALGNGRAPVDPSRTRVGVLAADAGHTLYASDGEDDCDGTSDALWRSLDGGNHWTKLGAKVDGPIALILADASRPGRLIVQTGRCGNGGRGPWGGWAYATDDGGATWRPLDPTRGATSEQAQYDNVGIVDGDTTHILIGYPERAYESLDGGATWRPTARAIAHPGGPVEWHDAQLFPSDAGILRVRPGATPERLYLP
jgi:photosystem II stability/assembly factor-like uncharacterized protein